MNKQIQKTNSKQDEKEHKGDGFNNLPYEITLNILKRLPICSLIQLGFMSRFWHTLAYDPHLANLHFSHTKKNNPCLIFHCDHPIKTHLYFVDFLDHDNQGIVRKISTPFATSMSEFNIISSCNGLLCLSNSIFDDTIYIYNPFTRNHKDLPKPIRFKNQKLLFGFGFHPLTNEYKVIKIAYYRHSETFSTRNIKKSQVQIYGLNDKTWRSIGEVPYELEQGSSEAILVSGRLHWVSRPSRSSGLRGRIIVSFDLADELFYEVPNPDFGGLRSYCFHLAVLGGCVSAGVYSGNGKFQIYVMKEYGNKDSWVLQEFDVGNHSLSSQNLDGRIIRVLGVMKNGEVLLEFNGESLALYDQKESKLRNLVFKGMPKLFRTVIHFGSFNWIDNLIEI